MNILQPERNEDFDVTKNNKSKSFTEKGKTSRKKSIKPRTSFHFVSNVTFELSDVEI